MIPKKPAPDVIRGGSSGFRIRSCAKKFLFTEFQKKPRGFAAGLFCLVAVIASAQLRSGLLRRGACHRAGHFGPDRWLLVMTTWMAGTSPGHDEHQHTVTPPLVPLAPQRAGGISASPPAPRAASTRAPSHGWRRSNRARS